VSDPGKRGVSEEDVESRETLKLDAKNCQKERDLGQEEGGILHISRKFRCVWKGILWGHFNCSDLDEWLH
jgi:hypothetical protein